jgi:hypothetical protein
MIAPGERWQCFGQENYSKCGPLGGNSEGEMNLVEEETKNDG